MRDNYYILLGLDPSVNDWPVIEDRLRERQLTWSRERSQGEQSARHHAARMLELLQDMEARLRDPNQRREIARAAAEQFTAQLDPLLQMLPDRTVDPRVVAILRDHVHGPSEDWIVGHLARRGKTVASGVNLLRSRGRGILRRALLRRRATREALQADASRSTKDRPTLEPVEVQAIRSLLRVLEQKSLYEFLSISPTASPQELQDAADTLYKELRRNGKTDAVSSARQELAGRCKVIFQDVRRKELYDNTLAVEGMHDLEAHLLIAGHDGLIDLRELEQILGEASDRRTSPEVALEYIEEYARRRNWDIQKQPGKVLLLAVPLARFLVAHWKVTAGGLLGVGFLAILALRSSPTPAEIGPMVVPAPIDPPSPMVQPAPRPPLPPPPPPPVKPSGGKRERTLAYPPSGSRRAYVQQVQQRISRTFKQNEGLERSNGEDRYLTAFTNLQGLLFSLEMDPALSAADKETLRKKVDDEMGRLRRACQGVAEYQRIRQKRVPLCPR